MGIEEYMKMLQKLRCATNKSREAEEPPSSRGPLWHTSSMLGFSKTIDH